MKKNLQTNVLLISNCAWPLISNHCRKKSAPSFDLPFDTVMTKLKLFRVVERKMYHARQTLNRDKLPFVNSTKSLIFDLTKILLPKRLILTYGLIAKVMYYQILYTELKSSY